MRLVADLLFDLIQDDLQHLEEELLRAVEAPLPVITQMGTQLVKSGGKRLRPALFFLAAHCGPDFRREQVMPLALAVEMIHMASLEHDDVIDEAGTRRGKPTANAVWGNKWAILGGDYLMAQALGLITGRGYGDEIGFKLAQLIKTLVRGEILQDEAVFRVCTEEEYFRHIREKTADFMALCCELGGMASGADKELQQSLWNYGHSLGMAFQITDDLLDVLENSEHIGKPSGNDIRQGIITLPVLRALETSAEGDELRGIVTNRAMTEADVARALEIVRGSDGVEYAKEKVMDYLGEAEAALPQNLRAEVRGAFEEAAAFIGQRSF